ncbi:RNA polymerase sigma factor [Aeoliella mucimassa]|uniref:RNA polymerase sigma factor n=1 Tax=Aeoliella mucimassa TaxID=2527972 RepID=A0A518AVQ1_9BACT|nr:sigma-70 family RNA polymerase sigma factor [Aeoliella mucimassa]QDU58790.1 RNA polymerase sigma factor [Aeoliella mucimassa]
MPTSVDDLARCRLVAQLLDRHGAALALYAAQWTDEPDDCLQEALIELAGLSELPQQPIAWLYCVVRRRAINTARGQQRRTLHEQHAWQQRLTGTLKPGERAELLTAVAELPELLREVVLLKTWGNLTFDEMAEVLGKSSSSLHREYGRAIQVLRNEWDTPCEKTTNAQ